MISRLKVLQIFKKSGGTFQLNCDPKVRGPKTKVLEGLWVQRLVIKPAITITKCKQLQHEYLYELKVQDIITKYSISLFFKTENRVILIKCYMLYLLIIMGGIS